MPSSTSNSVDSARPKLSILPTSAPSSFVFVLVARPYERKLVRRHASMLRRWRAALERRLGQIEAERGGYAGGLQYVFPKDDPDEARLSDDGFTSTWANELVLGGEYRSDSAWLPSSLYEATCEGTWYAKARRAILEHDAESYMVVLIQEKSGGAVYLVPRLFPVLSPGAPQNTADECR